MKKSTKTYTPSYIVNMNDIECLEDIDCVWALAKQDAGLPISNDELKAIVTRMIEIAKPIPQITIMNCVCKKEPWYKRFWNWLRRK